MPPIPYGGSDATALGIALTAFGGGMARHLPTASIHVPGLRLEIASDSGDYLAVCRRALVDDPAFVVHRRLQVTVVDYATHPDMPSGIWSGIHDVRALDRGLQAIGMEGSVDLARRTLKFCRPERGSGIQVLMAPGQYPPWESSFPLRDFLHWTYRHIGWQLLHAGTLANAHGGVMLVGEGGSGKSATVLAGVLAGLSSAGDDYTVVDATAERPVAHPVVRLMKQDARGLRRLGVDPSAFGPVTWQQKHEFDVAALRGGRLASVGLDAILIPRIARAARTSVSPAPARAVMTHLVPSNLRQLPGDWRPTFECAATLARRLPAFYLDLSEDADDVAGAIVTFLNGDRP